MAATRSNFIDVTGQRFGAWTVIERAKNCDTGEAQWLCQCSCGRRRVVRGVFLRGGRSKRCSYCNRRAWAKRVEGVKRKIFRDMWNTFGALYGADDETEIAYLREEIAEEIGFAPEERLSERDIDRLGDACSWEPPTGREEAGRPKFRNRRTAERARAEVRAMAGVDAVDYPEAC